MTQAAIETLGLVKRYGDVVALNGIDLHVPAQTVYALLGPNGAGKTTTINILITLTRPTSGSARVAGQDVVVNPQEVRRHIGVTFQDIVLDPMLTGRQVLDIHGRLYGQDGQERKKRIKQLVELVQLEDAIDRRVKTYSGGMKRRLELARGLLTKPDVLFLDEPTQGLDPQNRVSIWEYIRELNLEQGLTVLLTTHYMEEAEALAHTVGIIDHGKLVIEGSSADLVAGLGADIIRIRGEGDWEHFRDQLSERDFVQRVTLDEEEGVMHVYVDSSSRRLAEVVNSASADSFDVQDISVARPGLGDVFLHHTGRALRD